MPGYKVFLQDGGDIREGLTCSYCKLVLKDPVQTSESGQRLCRECYDKATKNPSYASELDPNDKVWLDSAVKKEIANLKVKCENYMVGCDWKGLFKQLMQHLQECRFVTVKCTCSQQVLLIEMELHLNKKCPQRLVRCKDCGEEMCFIELQNHNGMCPKAIRTCRNCSKEFPACQLADHMTHECKHVRCVCREGGTFESCDQTFDAHLKDGDKLGEHLKPIISGHSKVFEVVEQLTRRMSALERKNGMLERDLQCSNERIEQLESRAIEEEKSKRMLKERVEALEKENGRLVQSYDNTYQKLHAKVDQSMERVAELKDDLQELKIESKVDYAQLLAQLQGINNTAITSSGRTDQHSAHSMKQIEEKVLELERIINAVSAARNLELELQLQASLANAHDGTFVWCIPEVRKQIRDAVISCDKFIYSPPFYTGRNGYKMCIRAYLNGDGSGKGTHLSIFLVLMKGEYDPLLQWPFDHKVSLILVDQVHKKHLVQNFKPDPQSSSFQRPKTDMNVASGCPEFADLSILKNTSYVKDDVMYIKAIVDTSRISHP